MDRRSIFDKARFFETARRSSRVALILCIFAVPLAGGWLNLVEVMRDGVDGVQGLDGASGVAVSPDGLYVFSSASLDDGLAIFRRDASQDDLEFRYLFQDGVSGVFGLDGASATVMSPDQRHVYATGADDDTLTVLRRDASNDTFSFVASAALEDGVGGVFGLQGASAVAVTPDDQHVVVAARISSALTMFRRDASMDDLSFVDVETGWVGLGGASAVAARDETVFVVGEDDDALAIFTRNAGSDELTFVESHADGMAGVDGLDGARAVVVSPDGRFVYVAGAVDDAIAVFEEELGSYVFRQVYRDGVGGFDGLDGASALALSPSGELLFAAGRDESALAVFRRQENGTLTPLDVIRDGVDGIDGLGGAISLAVSPDALHIYVAASDEDAVSALRIITLLFEDGFESGDTSSWTASVP